MNATFAPVPAGARADRLRVAVGRARHRAARPGREPRPRRLELRVDGQQGRRQQQRPAAVLGPRPRDRRHPPLPRVVREPAQVRRASPAGSARNKPILAVKSGRSSAGTRAAASHTAALASSDVATDALFRQAGVVRVDTLAELLDTAQVLVHQPLPPGRRVAIVVERRRARHPRRRMRAKAPGLEVPVLSAATQAELALASSPPTRRPRTRSTSSHPRPRRPTSARSARCSRIPDIDAVLVIFVPPLVTDSDDVARAIVARRGRGGTEARSWPASSTQANAPEILQAPADDRRAIPSLHVSRRRPRSRSSRAAEPRRMAAAARRARTRTSPGSTAAAAHHARRAPRCEPPRTCGSRPRSRPTCARRSGSRSRRCATPTPRMPRPPAAAALGFPVALKAGAGAIVHKTDVGGVAPRTRRRGQRCGPRTTSMATALGAAMLGGVVVQPMVQPGIETIVGVTDDPSFGPLVLFGMGGVARRARAGHRAARSCRSPTSTPRELVRSLRSSPLLFGYRGAPPADVAALEDLLLRVGHARRRAARGARARLQPRRRPPRRACSRSTSRSTSSARPTTPPPRSAASAHLPSR